MTSSDVCPIAVESVETERSPKTSLEEQSFRHLPSDYEIPAEVSSSLITLCPVWEAVNPTEKKA